MVKFPLDENENGLHLEMKNADDDGFFIVETEHPEDKIYVYWNETDLLIQKIRMLKHKHDKIFSE